MLPGCFSESFTLLDLGIVKVGLPFGKQPPVAIYANLAKPAGVEGGSTASLFQVWGFEDSACIQ